MRVYLKKPILEEYYYEREVLSDPLTMEYNAGWNVFYDGYNYETGCIDFREEKWERDFIKRQENNRYFAYIVRKEDQKFIGYVNFHYNEKSSKYEIGIVIEHPYRNKGYAQEALKLLCDVAFFEYNIDALYNNFEKTRNAFKIFEKLGFKKVDEYKGKRFNKDIEIIEICLLKENYKEIK